MLLPKNWIAILALLITLLVFSGCATRYVMKNCEQSGLQTKKGEPIFACQKTWELWNH